MYSLISIWSGCASRSFESMPLERGSSPRRDGRAPGPRLQAHGAELVGELGQIEDSFRMCYVRDPEGIIVGLAEQIG